MAQFFCASPGQYSYYWEELVNQVAPLQPLSDEDITGASDGGSRYRIADNIELTEISPSSLHLRNSLTGQDRASNDGDEIGQEAATEEDCNLLPQWKELFATSKMMAGTLTSIILFAARIDQSNLAARNFFSNGSLRLIPSTDIQRSGNGAENGPIRCSASRCH